MVHEDEPAVVAFLVLLPGADGLGRRPEWALVRQWPPSPTGALRSSHDTSFASTTVSCSGVIGPILPAIQPEGPRRPLRPQPRGAGRVRRRPGPRRASPWAGRPGALPGAKPLARLQAPATKASMCGRGGRRQARLVS